MELRHLRYFVAVADELNFRKAAESLSISRPALSKQIKDLETEIGVRLLDRDTVSVSLTKAGEVFRNDAVLLLEQSRHAVERANRAQDGNLGKLRISSIGVIATDFLPATLKIFHKRYPSVEVDLVEMLPNEQLDALYEGAVDVGFAFGSDTGGYGDQDRLCVINSRYGIAVSRHHRWAVRGSVPLSELKDEPILCLGQGPRTHREEIFRFCTEEGFQPTKVRSIDGFDALITLVAADQGISLFPKVLDLASQGVVIVPIESKAVCEFRMWAVWQRDSPSQLVKNFIQLLEERI
jgi:DNA-binding transcriptional LysR family regulator